MDFINIINENTNIKNKIINIREKIQHYQKFG